MDDIIHFRSSTHQSQAHKFHLGWGFGGVPSISDALAECIVKGVPSMILPSLINALCRYQEIPNPYDEVMALKTNVDTYYINKHCKEKSVSHVKAELKKRSGDLGSSSQAHH
ncbi:unnamed protein product [Lupinus luteus]|uniref:Uncharacterized protein n=1 Tax=Lupinus luteus TaxID=3873 RepID=A0AAV1X554_LUPLU